MSTPEGYFDANATTPLKGVAREAWVQTTAKHWHNPSSLYREAGEARQLLEGAREEMAALFDCEAGRIVFNSGATEANNAVLEFAARTLPQSSKIAVSAIEHPCVADTAERLFAQDRLVVMTVTPNGLLDLGAFADHLKSDESIGFVSLMAANNETGVLQPWSEVAKLCRERGIPFHCDAAQWIGKLPLEGLSNCDYLTASAHKFGGPKGTGFLLCPGQDGTSKSTEFRGLIGGPQEHGLRGGTENLPAIAAMVAALKDCRRDEAEPEHRDRFEKELTKRIDGIRILGQGAERLWNTSMFVLPDHKNLRWLTRLSARGIAVSTGSACSSGKDRPSRVMQAMGCSFDEMRRVLRISSLPDSRDGDWEGLLDALVEVGEELATTSPGPSVGGKKISLGDL